MDADQFRDSDDEPNRAGDNARRGEPEPDKRPAESVDSGEADPAEQAEPRTRQEHADRLPAPDQEQRIDEDAADPDLEEQGGPKEARPRELDWIEEQTGDRAASQQGQPRAADDPPESDDLTIREKESSDTVLSSEENTDNAGYATEDFQAIDLDAPGLTCEDLDDIDSDILDRLRKAHKADLATNLQHTTDPDHKQWTAERNRIHGDIVQHLYDQASEVPCEHRAIIAGGLPGAGKTTILTQQAGIDLPRYLTINPDEIKEALAHRGLVPEVEGLSPMEASDLAHEESSVIAKHLARRAQADGKNIIWDITMSRLDSTQERIDSLRASGYTYIDAVFVDISIGTSLRRTQARHHEDQDKWRSGSGLGGRFIPPDVIRSQEDLEWGSKNRKTFETVKIHVNNWTRLDNNIDHRPAVMVDESKLQSTDTVNARSKPDDQRDK